MPLTNLRPAFYRVAGTQSVQSGWISRATGDVCDTEEGDHYRIRVVPRAREAFSIGERVEFTRPIELHAGDCILPSERAHVAALEHDSGVVDLYLEGFHAALEDNVLTLEPFRDEEVLGGLQLYKAPEPAKQCETASPSLWWAVLILPYVCVAAFAASQVLPLVTAQMMFGIAIVVTAIVLGQSHAILLALLSPIACNLFVVPPAFTFNVPTHADYAQAVVWLLMALVVPWLCEHSKVARRALERLERVGWRTWRAN